MADQVFVPVDSIAWLADQVNDAIAQSQSMMILLRQYSNDLDSERLRSAKLLVQLEEAENAMLLLRKKLVEYQNRNERLRKGLPEFEADYAPDPSRKTTGQLIDPGEPTVRIA